MTFNIVVFKHAGKDLNRISMMTDDMKQEFSEETEIPMERDEEMDQLLSRAPLTENPFPVPTSMANSSARDSNALFQSSQAQKLSTDMCTGKAPPCIKHLNLKQSWFFEKINFQ